MWSPRRARPRPLSATAPGFVLAGALALAGCDLELDDAPPITTDQVRDHDDKGPCVNCHQVTMGPLGRTPRSSPPISSDWVRPHPDRGVCESCHLVTPAGGAPR